MIDIQGLYDALVSLLRAEFTEFTVHGDPQESIIAPAVVPLSATGAMDWEGARLARAVHRPRIAFLVDQMEGGSITSADAVLRPLFARLVRLLSANFTLGGVVERWGNLTYTSGAVDLNGDGDPEYLGMVVEIDFKMREGMNVRA